MSKDTFLQLLTVIKLLSVELLNIKNFNYIVILESATILHYKLVPIPLFHFGNVTNITRDTYGKWRFTSLLKLSKINHAVRWSMVSIVHLW